MIKHNQNGSSSAMLISLILFIILFVASLGFGIYSYTNMLDYKNNVDQKISVAVTAANSKQMQTDAYNFAQQAKNPLTTYYGPSQYGSVVLNYPKTWSAYVDDTTGAQSLINGYFNPGHVPSISDQNSTFALRLQVLNQSYSQVLQQFTGLEQHGQLKATAYSLPKVPTVVGVEVEGNTTNGQNSVFTTMVILPVRSNTIEISTEGTAYLSDFNTYILPNFSFSP